MSDIPQVYRGVSCCQDGSDVAARIASYISSHISSHISSRIATGVVVTFSVKIFIEKGVVVTL
jgi:hypothetical protein